MKMNADIRWIDNPEIFRVNQIAAHSDHDYFTNYEALNSNSHNLIQSLNGQWKFCFSRNAMSRPADFYKEDYDTSYFDKIMVPGHIELAGYDQIRYINTLYPWEGKTYRRGAYSIESAGDGTGMFSEAEYNPVGSYIKKFDLDKELCGKRVRLFFEGVEQAMYVWLNGEFIGYAEDSFTPSEFDLTPYIREKDNVLAVEIHKMCSAAFLEDQDFFRFFGIFRNVSLRALPEAHVEDMWLNPVLNEDNVSGTLNTNIRVSNDLWDVFTKFAKGYREFELNKALALPTGYSLRFYMLMSGQVYPLDISLDNLKERLGIPADKYKDKNGKDRIDNFEERVLKPAKAALDESCPYAFNYVKVRENPNNKRSKVTGFRFYPVYQPQFRDEELEVKELQAKVTARHQIDSHVYEYLRYSCGFTSEEINRNKETLITAQEKIADLIGELAILNGKSREKNNPKGWIINSLKGKIKES